MAAYRTLEVTLISAKDLNEVNLFSKMDVYAVLSLAGEPRSAQRTPTDKDGGKNPSWKNATVRFFIPVDVAAASRLVVHVALRSERSLGDRDIGELHIPLNELFGDGGEQTSSQFVSYQVRKPNSGKPKGVLNLSYKFCEPPAAADYAPPPPSGYPAPGSSATAYPPAGAPGTNPPPYGAPTQYGYSAPPAGYGYPSQPQYGYALPPEGYGYPPPPYGYAPPPAGYGYPRPPAPQNGFVARLVTGLLGNAIGGLLLGDRVSDASEYDAEC